MSPAQKMYTLTEVSKATGISLPTLQRYKKLYQDRIPSEGEGRKQRYPQKALAVFERIRKENMKKRGRPAKKTTKTQAKAKTRAKAKARTKAKTRTKTKTKAKAKTRAKAKTKTKTKTKTKAKAKAKAKTKARSKAKTRAKSGAKAKKAGTRTKAASAGGGKLLTLLEIGRRTGISYPTLLRYVKLHLDEIPHVGSGRRRRYPPEAVKVFRRLRRASRRGPRAGAKPAASAAPRRAAGTDQALKARVRELEKAQKQVTRQLDEIVRLLKKPMRITVRSD